MIDLGIMHYCLGIEIWQGPSHIFISQQKYDGEILKAFGVVECKSVVTPMEVGLMLSTEDASPLVDETLYMRLVGSLIFFCNTWPDINFAVGVLSRFSNKPRENHWKSDPVRNSQLLAVDIGGDDEGHADQFDLPVFKGKPVVEGEK